MNCLTNAVFGTGSNTILDYTLIAKAKLRYEKEQRIQRELEEANRLFENDSRIK